MSEWRQQAIDGIEPGYEFEFSRTFSWEDTLVFGDVTRDYNPVHYDQRYSAAKGLSGRICHGLLVASMVCQMGGQAGWVASGMDFRFLKPVYFGDTVTCRMRIVDVDVRGQARAEAEFFNQRGEQVLSGVVMGYVPGPREKDVMRRMMADGDPTNKLGHPVK